MGQSGLGAIGAKEPSRIFVFLREHIGDIVNSTAALQCLRQCFPQAHLCVEVGERAAEVIHHFPGIDEIWLRPTHQGLLGKIALIRRLRRRRFDLAVILDDSADMVLQASLAGIPVRVGVSRKPKFRRLYTAYVLHEKTRHDTLDHFRDVVALLACDISDYRPRLYPSNEDQKTARSRLIEAGWDGQTPLVGIHPGASQEHRRWFPDRFAQVSDALIDMGYSSVIVGGKEDIPLAEQILQHAKRHPLVLTGMLTVLQLAGLMPNLRLFITGDTGPMHIAAAMGTRVLALYGRSNPVHTGPYGEGHRIIRHSEPCIGCDELRCVHDRECMKRIHVDEVIGALQEMLHETVEARSSDTSG